MDNFVDYSKNYVDVTKEYYTRAKDIDVSTPQRDICKLIADLSTVAYSPFSVCQDQQDTPLAKLIKTLSKCLKSLYDGNDAGFKDLENLICDWEKSCN